MTIRVAICDDHQLVLDGIWRLVSDQRDMELVGQATDGHGAVDLVRQHPIDVMVLDIAMPTLNGVVATDRILDVNKYTKIIALSMHISRKMITDMFDAGASAYVTKASPLSELLLAIRAVAKGEKFLSSDIAGDDTLGKLTRSRAKTVRGKKDLSAREKEVLQLIAEGQSTRDIADKLHLSEYTINRHRVRIMDKLDLRTIAELTRYAITEGISPLM